MSIDFYVAVPASSWPTATAMQACIAKHTYPVKLKRFPALREEVTEDRVLASIDGKDAYLEGELALATAMLDETDDINGRLRASGSTEMVKPDDVLMSVRVSSPAEVRAASYVISALIVCFDGLGFEPQGDTSGRADFARSLIQSADAIKGL